MVKQRKYTRSLSNACAALCAAALFLTAFAASAQALPANFWGVVPQALPSAEQMQRLHRGGVESMRVPLEWGVVQPSKGGAFDWKGFDATVKLAADAEIGLLPFLNGAPSWAVPSATVPGTGGAAKAPAHYPASGSAGQAWATFVKAAVLRYGPNGTFWSENPAVTKRPIRTWQLWNEENFKYFVARPNPAEYGRLVKLSYPALKSADPGAKLVLGGLFARPAEAVKKFRPPRAFFATDFLERMYRANPGINSKFSGIALHPYTSKYQTLTPEIEEVREVLRDNHDAAKPLWITELGWSSKPAQRGNSFAKGPSGQVTQLNGAFSLLKRKQAKWKIQQIFWFSVDDQPGSCNFCDGTGLFAKGFVPKKSWSAYVRFAGGTP